jgi:hypothetical protein
VGEMGRLVCKVSRQTGSRDHDAMAMEVDYDRNDLSRVSLDSD